MKVPEDYPYLLDCWNSAEPDIDNDMPAKQDGYERRDDAEAHADRLWAARKRNGFKCLILYRDAGEDWEQLRRWD
jgi:hypothetical protein